MLRPDAFEKLIKTILGKMDDAHVRNDQEMLIILMGILDQYGRVWFDQGHFFFEYIECTDVIFNRNGGTSRHLAINAQDIQRLGL